MTIEGDGYEISMSQDKKWDGDQLISVMKFDRYFMYGIDNMGATGNGAPDCGSGQKGSGEQKNSCNDLVKSHNSCCAHVVLHEGSGRQTSFYRCMNQKVVDASFSMEMDGIKMSMQCNQSGASKTYITSAIVASIMALVSTYVF